MTEQANEVRDPIGELTASVERAEQRAALESQKPMTLEEWREFFCELIAQIDMVIAQCGPAEKFDA